MTTRTIDMIVRRFFLPAALFMLVTPELTSSQDSSGNRIRLLEALNLTLSRNPQIQLQRRIVEGSEGTLLRSGGTFDLKLTSALTSNREHAQAVTLDNIGVGSALRTNTLSYRIGLNKRLRSGFLVSTDVEMSRTEQNTLDSTTPNTARVRFGLEMPLLKGRGKKATTASETAAKIDYEIAGLNLQFQTSQMVLDAVSAYWDYVATWKILEIFKEAEARADLFVKEANTLIKAGELPRVDIQQPHANVADKAARRISSEQDLFEARQRLGITIGLDNTNITRLPLPEDDFPEIIEAVRYDSLALSSFFTRATNLRRDYLAAKLSQNSTSVLLYAARHNSKHGLNLKFDVGYTGFAEGKRAIEYFSPIKNNIGGLDFSTSISFESSAGLARGLMYERRSLHEQAIIQTKDLERQIHSNVVVAVEALKQSILELQRYQEAIELHHKAVENERKRVQLGISTLIDLIFSEDRLTNTLLSRVSAYLRYAKTLVRLRFETGTLVRFLGRDVSITHQQLITVPSFK